MIAVTVAAVAMGVTAATHPDWLLEIDEPITDAVRGDALVAFFDQVFTGRRAGMGSA